MEKMMDVSNKILSNLTVYMKYARFIPELNRRETWEELVTRNKEMHKKKYPQLASEIEEVYKMVYDKKVLPSMRSLQFGGKPIEISPNRIYNCFSRETKFITSIGMQSFEDFSDGDSVVVLTHTGKWKNAIVKRYGKQNLNRIVFHRGRSEKVVFATENHRWLMYDGSETTNLKVGDILAAPPKINTFDYDSATPLERLYWCYGYVYGDGTICRDRDRKPRWSMVRLCGTDKSKYLYRFEEMGFKTSSSASLNGDVMVYTGNYLKDSPDLKNDDVALIRAFVDGYLTADAYKNPDWYSNNDLCKYKSILSSNVDHIDFLDNALCLAGYYVTHTKDLTGCTTNFGIRPYTKSFSITNSIGSRTNTSWSVYSIEDAGRYEDVWCLEVEDDHSFILDGGIVTGNCAYLPVDDWRAFGEIMFLLLGGTGVGYSVQKHHIEKLPPIHKPKTDKERRYLVSDSIEGWADAVKALLKSYFVSGSSLRFDYSDIRPKGARLITSGGKAPGPEPLRICIEKIRSLLDTKTDGEQLKPIEVHDIVCHIADAVLAGGIRRAALISLFSADDDEMISCKFGDWWELNPQRGRANNSAVLLRSKVTEEFFKNLWKKIEYSNAGEPGIYLSNDKDWGTNPSLRAGTKVLTTDGIFPIEQLDGKEFFVKNLNGEISKAKCWLSGKNKQLYKITLTGNHTYYATPEHEWPVWNGEEYVKVRSEDLSAGNILPIIRESSLFDGSLGNYKDGFFIGWHLGDGWTSIRKDGGIVHGMVVSHTESEYVKDKLEEYLSTELKSSAKFSFRDNGTFELNTTLNSWNYLQEKFGYHKKESGLPVAVWERGSEEFRKGIIDGLFSSDGHVSNNRITLTTKHEKLANDVSELLGFYGIKTVISKSNSILNENVYTRFDVKIEEKHSILHFRNVFKLTNSKKQEVLDSIEYKYSIPDLKQIEIIDVELSDVVEDVWDISVYDETHCFQIAHAITGNCCEIALRPFQFCNLCEVNVSDVETQEELEARVKAATFIGTLQAGYTDFHYLRPVWQRTTEKDALLGVGMTGIGSGRVMKLDVKAAAKVAKEENERVAGILGIGKAARITTIKPAGTSSLTLGCSSGIHAWHNDYYLRRIRVGKNEAIYHHLAVNHPELVEDDYFRPHDTAIIGVPQKAPDGSILRTESPLQLLERVKWFSQNWIKPGHRNGMNTHNISATVSIRDHEWDAVGTWMWENKDHFNGLSVLNYDGGAYVQAPFEDITEEEYHRLMATLHDVDLSKVIEFDDNTDLTSELACSGNACEIK